MNAEFSKKNAGLIALLLIFSGAVSPAASAPGKAPATSSGSVSNAPSYYTESVFTMPTGPKEGKDPFYPKSDRPWRDAKPAAPQQLAPVTPQTLELKLSGISGTPEHRLAIINGKTFEQGEESEVRVGTARINIHVLKIEADTATVQVGTQQQVLRLRHSF